MHEILHALRIKGRATVGELAQILGEPTDNVVTTLAQLGSEGLAKERTSGRRPGWLLTAEGKNSAEQQLRAAAAGTTAEWLAEQYKSFLRCNDQFKQVCANWQTTTDPERRFALLDQVHEIHEQVAPALDKAGDVVGRYHRYRTRLSAALDRVSEDPRYLVSPVVDSYHTVWFECHEDFLISLGRSRSTEGSA